MNEKILLIEDDEELALLIHDYLKKNGYTIEIVNDGAKANHAINKITPDLVILDIMLPNKTGMDICRDARPDFQGPILMMTALDDDVDQMLGLELGADDYIIKPVPPRLLLARVRNLLRRIAGSKQHSTSPMIQIGLLSINTTNFDVCVNGELIDLTTAEYDLLLLLARDIGQVVYRNVIVQELRGFEYDGLDRSIDRRISRLRKKLSAEGEHNFIKTIRGKGYLLCTSIAQQS